MLPQVNIIRAKNGDFLSFYERAGISGVLTAHGVWDEPTIFIATCLIEACVKKPVILDIGSNMGTFAIPIGKYIYQRNGTVHCFEPQRIIYYQLCGNIFLNQLDNIYAHNLAISNINATKEIDVLDYHQAWNIGAYSLVPGKNEQSQSLTKQECIFSRLDNFDINENITLIKIDVEGMEYEVLIGGINKISECGSPPILFESLNNDLRSQLVIKLLVDLGYRLTQYANEDWLAQHPDWETEIEISNDNGKIICSKKSN